jgi:tight adherence protein B
MDYRVYHLSRKEVCKSITLAGLLTAVVAYLFYASWLGIVFFPVFIWFFMKRQKKAGREQMQIQLAREFMDTLRSISAALLAGFSIENAWKEAEKEILALYGKRSYMYQEVKEMNCSISLNQPLELLLGDFSTRSGNTGILKAFGLQIRLRHGRMYRIILEPQSHAGYLKVIFREKLLL